MEQSALLLLLLLTPLALSYLIAPALQQPALLFQRAWGGSGRDYGYHVAMDSFGNAYVSVRTSSFGRDTPSASYPVLLKYNSAGLLQWQRLWSEPDNDFSGVGGVVVDGSGNVYLTGSTPGGISADPTVLLLKFNSTGSLIWQRAWIESGASLVVSGVAVDASGNIYVAGHIVGYGGLSTVLLLKFDSDGNMIWQRTWGGTGADVAHGVAVDRFGSVYIAGSTGGVGKMDILLLKFSSSGNLTSKEAFGDSKDDVAYHVAIDPSDNVYLTGCTHGVGTSEGDGVLLKFEASGYVLWQRAWSSGANDCSYSDSVDFLGNVYTVGDTMSSRGAYNAYLMKFSSSGNPEWEKTLFLKNSKYAGSLSWRQPSSGNSADAINDLALDSSGNLFVTGSIEESADFTLGVRNYAISTPSLVARDLTADASTPNGGSSALSGVVSAIPGSEIYSGSSHVFLFKLGESSSIYIDTALVLAIITTTAILLLRRRVSSRKPLHSATSRYLAPPA